MVEGSIGFLLGAIVCLIFFGTGVCVGDNRSDKEQHDPDSDVRIYIYNRDRSRGSDKRVRKYSNEEMIFVLHNLKRLTHGWERDIVDAMIEEKEAKLNERKKMEL